MTLLSLLVIFVSRMRELLPTPPIRESCETGARQCAVWAEGAEGVGLSTRRSSKAGWAGDANERAERSAAGEPARSDA